MSCETTVFSNDTYDFIVSADETNTPLVEPLCIQPINEEYAIWYYDKSVLPPLSISNYSYTSIPKCYFLMDSTSLDVSGILAIQNQPTLSLKGQGVFIGIIDTGIDYTNPLFRDSAGNTRIYSIWDQTEVSSNLDVFEKNVRTPEGFLYGTEYTRSQINQALLSENPRRIVPEQDENGHGTFLASLAAGGVDLENDFVGAAPESELVIVKLKEAKDNLRDFFYFPRNEVLYQENDIMAGIAYLEAIAQRENRPLVILLGLGTNQGSHANNDPLSLLLNDIGTKRGSVVVVASGNEAPRAHHFYGEAKSVLAPVSVEINIEKGVQGFCMELWSYAPELVRVEVQSPTGQRSQGGFPVAEETQTTNFIFENTQLTLDYRIAGRRNGDLLVFFRFRNPTEGIWKVLVYPEIAITGAFHIWLPIQSQIGSDITFIRPDPDTTITTPSSAEIPISTGGYNAFTGAIDIHSGRGFAANGQVKPEFCAPSVEVEGAGLRNNYIEYTGTSVAAAITGGAVAQVLEWGIIRGNAPTMNSVEVKNFLIRGCKREGNIEYPNQEWGYGKLDLYSSFLNLRE